MAHQLDTTDIKILSILQRQGRVTNLQLSQEIGLSPGPTLERVKKLENNGYIAGYSAKLSTEMLGLGVQVMMLISLKNQHGNSIGDFKDQIRSLPEIVECSQVTGGADYVLKVLVQNISAFEKLINDKLSKIEQIGTMQSMVVLSNVKEDQGVSLDHLG